MEAARPCAAWAPDAAFARATNWRAFLDRAGIAEYTTMERRAAADPEWFWGAVLRHFEVPFATPWTRLRDADDGLP
ncbi:MAG: hypothetical protein AB7P02_06660 [Alphaproteobacteria bacterium]